MSHRNGRAALTKSLCAMAIAGSFLSGCVIAVDADNDDDWRYGNSSSRTENNIRLMNGDRAKFRCPRGYEVFVDMTDDGAERYGCAAIEDDGR